jgi:hypothetical protein
MGWSGRRLAHTPSQGAPVRTPRSLPREKRPLYPLPTTPKALALATSVPPRQEIRRASQPERVTPLALVPL